MTPPRWLRDYFTDLNYVPPSVRACVVQDLANAAPTTMEDWLELYLGMGPVTYRQWRTKIAEEDWFEDKDIQKALEGYAAVDQETPRYNHFIALLTRIIEMGRNVVHPEPGSDYPINDLRLLNHSDREIEHTAEHGNSAARCKPDVILVRDSPRLRKGCATWTDVLTWFVLKSGNGKLEELLESVRTDKAASPVDQDSAAQCSQPAGLVAKVSLVRCRWSLTR